MSGANVITQTPGGVEPVTPPVRALAAVVVAIAAVTLVGYVVPLGFEAIGYVYLFTVIALSLCVGHWLAMVAVVLSILTWDYVFVPPRLSFLIGHLDDALVLGTYSVTVLVASQLIVRIRTLQREREQLLTMSERLHRTLLDSVSHELKTPLAVLRSAVEKLEGADPARRVLLTTEIRAATLRLDQLVTNLLDQTRLESGALRPHLDWCDAHDLIAVARRDADLPRRQLLLAGFGKRQLAGSALQLRSDLGELDGLGRGKKRLRVAQEPGRVLRFLADLQANGNARRLGVSVEAPGDRKCDYPYERHTESRLHGPMVWWYLADFQRRVRRTASSGKFVREAVPD